MSRRVLARPLAAATVASALVLTAPVAALAGDQGKGHGQGHGQEADSSSHAEKHGEKQGKKAGDKSGKKSGKKSGQQDDDKAQDSKGKGGSQDPAGNNGTVKIAPYGEIDRIPNNTPHPGCTFQVEWYGFDEGDDVVSQVSFAMQAPTNDVALTVDGPSEVFVGGDPATGAGTETGLDGREAYTLSFDGEPHPQQGYHVKLTVATPHSKGNDTKTKVFWVEDCEPSTAGEDSTDTQSDDGTDATDGESGDDTGVAGTSLDSDDESTDRDAETGEDSGVMGTTLTLDSSSGTDASGTTAADGSAVPTGVDAGAEGSALERAGDLARSPWALLVLALGLAAGAAAVVTRRAGR